MPDVHRIQNELESLLSRPQYASMLDHRNAFRNTSTKRANGKPPEPEYTPASIAAYVAHNVWKNHLLLNPVEVVELRGPVELYRAHDGSSRKYSDSVDFHYSAGTLGGSWVERPVMAKIWDAAKRFPVPGSQFRSFMSAANFVLPEWNDMRFICCMQVPAGCYVAVLRGDGDWRAMRTKAGRTRPDGAPSIETPGDTASHLKIEALRGTPQCVVPLFNDSWVFPVNETSATWPLLS